MKKEASTFKQLINSVFPIAHKSLELFRRINIKTVNGILSIGAITVLLSHVLFTAGLYDSAFNLFEMILYEKTQVAEISRTIFENLQALPALAFIKKT